MVRFFGDVHAVEREMSAFRRGLDRNVAGKAEVVQRHAVARLPIMIRLACVTPFSDHRIEPGY